MKFSFCTAALFLLERASERAGVRAFEYASANCPSQLEKISPIEDLHQRQIYVRVSAIFQKRYIAVTTAVTRRNSPRNTFQVEILESRVIITKPYAKSMAQHKSIYTNKSSAARSEHLSRRCTLSFYSRVLHGVIRRKEGNTNQKYIFTAGIFRV